MEPSTRLTVVMATRNRPELARGQVDRLLQMAHGPDVVVVVVDDEPSGGGPELPEDPRVVVVDGPRDGPASARNRGLAEVGSGWVAFLDDDDVPDVAWAGRLREAAAASPDRRWVSVGWRRRWGSEVRRCGVGLLGPAFGDVRANYLAGTFAVRREVLDELGGFSDGLRSMEFTDLALGVLPVLARRPGAIGVGDGDPLEIVVRPPQDRPWMEPTTMEAAWTSVEQRHRGRFRLDRGFRADQCAVLGVAWARAGDPSRARVWFDRSLRAQPGVRRLVRSVAVRLPVARRRWWPQSPTATSS